MHKLCKECSEYIVNLISYDFKNNYYMILEKFDQDVFEYVVKKGKIDNKNVFSIMNSLFSGLEFMHKNKLIHGDIKLENLFMRFEGTNLCVKIGDLGSTRSIVCTQSFGCTINYCAPEQIEENKIGTEIDMWAAGIILYILLLDTPGLPWNIVENSTYTLNLIDNFSQLQLMTEINEYKSNEDYLFANTGITDKQRIFVRKLLCVDYKERITSTDALQYLYKYGIVK